MSEPIVLTLVSETWTKDSIGQMVATYTDRDVFGERESVNRSEWSAAGEQGLNPEFKVDVFFGDYEGEKIARMDVNGSEKTFAIYRTYRDSDTVELYLEWKTGESSNPKPDPPTPPTPTPDEGGEGNG